MQFALVIYDSAQGCAARKNRPQRRPVREKFPPQKTRLIRPDFVEITPVGPSPL
jgi:hypothetical protein